MNVRALTMCLLIACGSQPPAKVVPPTTQPAAPSDLRARVERKILPAVQVVGEDVAFTLAERMAKYRVPGISIAVFDKYKLVWAGAYGVTDVETKTPVSETTLFQAGSISKSVNALAVMLAVADGTVDLDVPVNSLLKSWKLPDNELTRATPVTLRMLLGHRAGTTVHGFPGYPTGAPLPTLSQVLDGTPPANTPAVRVDLAPNTKLRYSGGGTTITQLVLVDKLAAPYPAILAKRVLGPLGMTNSTYEQPLPANRLAQAAAGHLRDGTVVPTKRHVYPEMAAAGLWTTPTDLAKFFLELARARTGGSKHVNQVIATTMTTEAAKGEPAGLGVFLSDRNGAAMFGHDGADEGFQASASASLDGGYGVIVMANSDNGSRMFPEIERTVFAAMHWPGEDKPVDPIALPKSQRDRMAGTFTEEDGRVFTITATEAGLVQVRPFGEPARLVAVSGNALIHTDSGVRFTFTRDDTIEIAIGDRPVRKATRLARGARLPLLELAAGRFDDAVALWKQQLLQADPRSAFASEVMHNLTGYELLVEGHGAEAIVIFRAVVAVFPDSSNAYDSLGEAYLAAGKKPEAIAAYEAAIAKLEADPRIPKPEKLPRRQHAEKQLAKLRR